MNSKKLTLCIILISDKHGWTEETTNKQWDAYHNPAYTVPLVKTQPFPSCFFLSSFTQKKIREKPGLDGGYGGAVRLHAHYEDKERTVQS